MVSYFERCLQKVIRKIFGAEDQISIIYDFLWFIHVTECR
jgi:hypothetical protein